MPINPTFPGIYLEEVAGGSHAIIGVPTSITAFVGRAARGPVHRAQVIESFTDYESAFGGLSLISPMSYAVRDFFLNGGSRAVIVRLYHPPPIPRARVVSYHTQFKAGFLTLNAANPGTWGANLRAVLDTDVDAAYSASQRLQRTDLFNLSVTEAVPGGRSEHIDNVGVKPGMARRLDTVLAAESQLVCWNAPTTDSAVQQLIQGLNALHQAASDTTTAAWDQLSCDELTQAERDQQRQQQNLTSARAALAALLSGGGSEADIAMARQAVADAQAAADKATGAMKTALKNHAECFSDGVALTDADLHLDDGETDRIGVHLLDDVDVVNILCVPQFSSDPPWTAGTLGALADYCVNRRAFLIVDPPPSWAANGQIAQGLKDDPQGAVATLGITGSAARNAAVYFPRLLQANPLRGGRLEEFAPCGAIAGIFAKMDDSVGVWKAPAGLNAAFAGAPSLSVTIADTDNGLLNRVAINCLRSFPIVGRVVWGARTLRGSDRIADDYKFVPVRRMALFIEASLYASLQWVVFEPNDEALWAQLRLDVTSFMHDLYRQGAFQGNSAQDAYFVKCDSETTTQSDIDRGVVNIVVGFAGVAPAEFIIIRLQQLAGQVSS